MLIRIAALTASSCLVRGRHGSSGKLAWRARRAYAETDVAADGPEPKCGWAGVIELSRQDGTLLPLLPQLLLLLISTLIITIITIVVVVAAT